jgi:hypothetical protein
LVLQLYSIIALSQSHYGRAGGGVAGSVVFGGSFAGSGVAEVLGGGVVGAVLVLSGGDAPVLGGAGRSQAVRPSEMSNAAAKVIFFMLLLSLETKVLRVIRYASFDITRSRDATGRSFAAQQDKAHR